MKVFISRAIITDPQSPSNGRKCDIQIENGIITSIQTHQQGKKPAGFTFFDANSKYLLPSFVDLRAHSGEPGCEQKETLASLAAAAHAGGFAAVVCRPDTNPVVQSKNDISYFYSQSKKHQVEFWPCGALTHNCEGKEMNELYDMHQAGAVAFSNGDNPIMHAGVLLRCLQYTTIFNGLIMTYANDTNIAPPVGVNEGITSTYIGIKGMPAIAEELAIIRDLKLTKYTDGRIHFSRISTAGAVDLIKRAKKEGLKVTCDVSVANLVWDDSALHNYDANLKLNPPLRTAKDKQALWNGLIDGTIDAICTDHYPQDIEHKNVEFAYASPGMVQLQTACSLLIMNAPKNYTLGMLATHLSHNPRAILNKPLSAIVQGNTASCIIVDTDTDWQFDSHSNLSMSSNSPVFGTQLKGKVTAAYTHNTFTQF